MTRITLRCPVCRHTARRDLKNVPGCHGVSEAYVEPAKCPRGHGPMVREDGRRHVGMPVAVKGSAR